MYLDLQDIEKTEVWELYERGRNYHRMRGYNTDADKCSRFVFGNQWEGAKLGNIQPVQINYIKRIYKYKQAVIHDNLYGIVLSSQNYESRQAHTEYERYCTILNSYMGKVWEQQKMDKLGRKVTRHSAVFGEGIMYVDFDKETMMPICEVIDKVNVFYADENDDDIQSQPYILISKRMPVSSAVEFALARGCSEEDTRFIVGDTDSQDELGDTKDEKEDQVTIVYKLYKKNGTVHFSCATKLVDICKDVNLEIKLYPVAHMNWEETDSARSEGEVKYHIPTQIEVNKIATRRIASVQAEAYPKTIVDSSKITNPSAINTVGGIIKTNGSPVEDVRKIISTLPPSSMSADVKLLFDDLINITSDLASAGDSATGNVNPESASGRAILAVQQASQAPINEQKENYKDFIEDIAHIWLEYLIVHSVDGIPMEETVTDPMSGEEYVQMVVVPQKVLQNLQATIKVDVTPKSVYDRFAMEQTLENLLMHGLLDPERTPALEAYTNLLDYDMTSPKRKLEEHIKKVKEDQKKIAQMEAQAQEMQMRAEQFLYDDVDAQAQMIADAEQQIMQQNAMA